MQAQVGNKQGNLEKIRKFILEGKDKKIDIICFPELAIHGYIREKASELAEKIPNPTTDYLVSLAYQTKITILVGMLEKSSTDKPYITHLVVFPTGDIKKYRKTHIGKSEEVFFIADNEIPVFKGTKANFAVQICWDSHFPEVSTIQALKGAEIIFTPYASPTMVGNRREIWLKYLTARAYDNSVFLAACNLIGENGAGSNFCGGALVLDPKGNVVGEDFSGQESMLVVDLPGEKINKLREKERKTMRNSFYLQYRRPEIYKDILK